MIQHIKNHLKNSNMGYFYHMSHASLYGFRLIWAGVKSIIHGIFPVVWKYDGPRTIIKIYSELRKQKHIREMMKTQRENETE